MVKKIKQFAALAMACTFAASGLFAIDYKQITVKDVNGVSVTIDIPSDVFSLVEGRESEINDALKTYKVDASKIREAESAVKDAYENIKGYRSNFDLKIEQEGNFNRRLANLKKLADNNDVFNKSMLIF